MHIDKAFIEGNLLVGLLLAVAGCSQNDLSGRSPAEPAHAPAEATARRRPQEDDSGVRLANSQSKVRPSDDVLTGQADSAPNSPAEPEDREPAELSASKAPLPLDEVGADELTMPKVSLTRGLAATCLAQVGDTLPEIKLADLDGREQSLAKLYGAKLTVVVFWNGTKPTALEEVRDLEPDISKRFAGNGVAVVGINTLENPQTAREFVSQAGARYPNLSDADGEAFKQVATEKVPRTYLVDPSGKILWFDLEYSRSTRRELAQAIRYRLTHE